MGNRLSSGTTGDFDVEVFPLEDDTAAATTAVSTGEAVYTAAGEYAAAYNVTAAGDYALHVRGMAHIIGHHLLAESRGCPRDSQKEVKPQACPHGFGRVGKVVARFQVAVKLQGVKTRPEAACLIQAVPDPKGSCCGVGVAIRCLRPKT